LLYQLILKKNNNNTHCREEKYINISVGKPEVNKKVRATWKAYM
jgi:hypothetical protein